MTKKGLKGQREIQIYPGERAGKNLKGRQNIGKGVAV